MRVEPANIAGYVERFFAPHLYAEHYIESGGESIMEHLDNGNGSDSEWWQWSQEFSYGNQMSGVVVIWEDGGEIVGEMYDGDGPYTFADSTLTPGDALARACEFFAPGLDAQFSGPEWRGIPCRDPYAGSRMRREIFLSSLRDATIAAGGAAIGCIGSTILYAECVGGVWVAAANASMFYSLGEIVITCWGSGTAGCGEMQDLCNEQRHVWESHPCCAL